MPLHFPVSLAIRESARLPAPHPGIDLHRLGKQLRPPALRLNPTAAGLEGAGGASRSWLSPAARSTPPSQHAPLHRLRDEHRNQSRRLVLILRVGWETPPPPGPTTAPVPHPCSTSRTRMLCTAVSSWISTSACARRLYTHTGFFGAPPFEPTSR